MKKTLLSLLMAVVMTVGAMAQEFPDGGFETGLIRALRVAIGIINLTFL